MSFLLQEEIKAVLELFMEMKKGACLDHGGPVDLQPMLHFKGRDGSRQGALLHGHPTDSLSGAWKHMLEYVDPECAIVMTEAYCRTSREFPENHEPGAYERDFKDNPLSDVQEILNVHGIDIETGVQFSGFVGFRIGDDGQPVFDEPYYAQSEGRALECNIPVALERLRNMTAETNGQ
jgi:hypothetical protein